MAKSYDVMGINILTKQQSTSYQHDVKIRRVLGVLFSERGI